MTKKKDNDIISRIPKWAWLLLSLLAAMLLWVVLSQNPVTARSFSPPWVTFAAIQTMISRGVLFQDIASSLISAGIGFALGFFIGVPVAFLMAWYRPVRYILEPWIQFIRNIPPLAYVPLVVISAALTTLIAAESTGAIAGLGMRIKTLSTTFDTPPMLLYIIIVGVIGMIAEKVLKFFERRLTSWQEKREI